MAIEKRKLWRIDENGTPVLFHPETEGKQVIYDDTTTGLGANNVQSAIEKVKGIADEGGSAVKSVNSKTPNEAGNVTLGAGDVGALPDSTKYGKTLDLTYEASTGKVTAVLKDQNGTTLSTKTIDLPLELLIQSGTVETCTQPNVPVSGYKVGDIYIDLVLANGQHIYILASDLIDEVSILAATGTGNAITSIAADKNKITPNKGKTFVEASRKVNNKPLSSDISLDAGDVGALPDTTKYAGSQSAGGSANSAVKLSSARTFSATGDATGSVSSDLTSGFALALTLKNSGVSAGTYSAVTVNVKGIVTGGGQFVEWGTLGQTEPSANLVAGGIFFELQQ